MYRTDASGNVSNLFVDKVPGVSPGTSLDSAFLNEVQEELCNLVTSAGISLVKGTRTQVRDAVNTKVAEQTVAYPAAHAGWASVSGQTKLHYRVAADGRVTIAGTAFRASGSSTSIFGGSGSGIPGPSAARRFLMSDSTGAGVLIEVGTNGDVHLVTAGSGALTVYLEFSYYPSATVTP